MPAASKPDNEDERLRALGRYGILDTPEEQAYDDVTRLIAHICGAPIAVVNLIDRDRQFFKSEVGLGVRETPLDTSICAHAILQPDVLVVPDTRDDPRFADNPLVTGEPHLRFYAGALLESPDGHALGTFCVLDHRPRPDGLTDAQRDALRTLARQVMSLMELRLRVREQAEAMRERDEREEALGRALGRLRRVVDSQVVGYVTGTEDGRLTEANDYFLRLTGYTRAELERGEARWDAITPPEYLPLDAAAWESVRATGTCPPYEKEYRRQDGSRVWVQVTVASLPEGPDEVLALVLDISERKRAEAELRASEAQYRTLFETATIGIACQDETAAILDANPAAERILGLTLDQMQGRTSLDPRWRAVREDGGDFPGEDHYVPRALRSGKVERGVMGLFHPGEGRYRWVDVTAVPQFRPGEARPHLVYALFAEITERYEALRALERSEARYRALVDASSQVVWTNSPEGRMEGEQPGWAALTGQSPEEYRGYGWAAAVHPEDAGPTVDEWNRSVAGRRPFVWEHRVRGKDGVYRTFSVRGVPVLNADGTIREWVGVHTDVTERREAERIAAEAAAKNERIAETLQRAMLLTPPSNAFPGLTVASRYVAAWDEADVGGDFFDAFALPGGRVALVVGDATGKGLDAARHTSEIQFLLRGYLREDSDPAAALGRLNRYLCQAQELGDRTEASFCAAAVVVLEPATGAAACAAAGAEPPLIVRSATGGADEVDVRGPVLGADPGLTYEAVRAALGFGDVFVLTTDGITEARDPETRRFFGYEGLAGAATEAARATGGDPEGVAVTVVERARAFSGGKMRDDVCLLLARREPPPEGRA
jgi:PAS domain S-box-containing protein